MKILIIPDVHGREFWIEPCSHADEFDKIIFLGDFHDPYVWKGDVTYESSRKMLKEQLIPFFQKYENKVVCLLGNHDCNYIVGDCADRIDRDHRTELKELFKQIPFQLTYDKIPGYLFSHSGVLPEWLDINGFRLDDLKLLEFTNPALMQISPMRGGWNECGSCIWGDIREYNNAYHFKGLYQIFGHTQLAQDPVITDDFACLDCRKAFVLDTETKELKEWGG